MKHTLILALALLLCAATATAQVGLDRSVVSAGGGTTASGNHTLRFTVGQPAVGLVSGNLYDLSIGFWTAGLGDFTAAPDDDLPKIFSLDQNYPNPFNPMTVIRFSLPEAAPVTLTVYNVRGQRVRTLLDEDRAAGRHEVQWDGTDDHGRGLSSGTYLARIVSSAGVQNSKMLLAR